ncbi:hypothetical protein WBJ53_08830 [Spirosoma sp. SC4-14]|uniref:hypothetical protein n=1 Tax=Spirosoma sp. SC4-14 TaxID=3128900 RepID=UPI0030CCBD57
MRYLILVSLLTLVWLFNSCNLIHPGQKDGKFQKEPINLTDFNSEYDDYNSTLPSNKYGYGPLIFSSKRAVKDRFNLVCMPFNLTYDDKTDKLSANTSVFSGSDVLESIRTLKNELQFINGAYNVLGPLALPFNTPQLEDNTGHNGQFLTLFADDQAGNLNIRFGYNAVGNRWAFVGPMDVSFLNSSADDAYPTFYSNSPNGEYYTTRYSEIYFTSNRDGNFDIYRAIIPTNKSLLDVLGSGEKFPIEKVESLSSPYDDKCPFIIDNKMVFTSNRPGGQGGYDLYSSRNINGAWSAPENLGSRINSSSDDYRPIIPRDLRTAFNYDLLIFSSNRPGGLGGFDLYMVGLE